MPKGSLTWLITGGGGMVAADLRDALNARGDSVIAPRHAELDITDAALLARQIARNNPDIIVNCAAHTSVDLAESEPELAMSINAKAVAHLAAAADAAGALLVQISTDFVFDGTRREPYQVGDPTCPISVYGRSKLGGERNAMLAARHLVVRTSWLFGTRGHNFVESIRNQIRKGTPTLRVVDDQRGRPTYTPSLARAVIRLARLARESESARGIVHYADAAACSWYDFARVIVEESGADTAVVPVTTAEFPRPAPRPAYSVLSTERYERLTGVAPESWRDGLREYLSLRP